VTEGYASDGPAPDLGALAVAADAFPGLVLRAGKAGLLPLDLEDLRAVMRDLTSDDGKEGSVERVLRSPPLTSSACSAGTVLGPETVRSVFGVRKGR